jgi:hypothetical protein
MVTEVPLVGTGMEGKVYVLDSVSNLLPLSFSNEDMK